MPVRPRMSDLGVHSLTFLLLALQAGLLALTVVSFRVTGLTYAWSEAIVPVGGALCLLALWGAHVLVPARRQGEWVVTEAILVTGLIATVTIIGSPFQYAAIALKRPLVDEWLAAADAGMGVYVPALVEWTRAHPWIQQSLSSAYFSLLPQLILPVAVVGCWFKDRAALWEYAFHFHVCVVVTLLGLALWPAACAFTYYGFDSLLDQTRFIRHFHEFRTGATLLVQPSDVEGMISFPSFHVAGALMVTWAFRRRHRWLMGLGILNAWLVAATVLTGAHYAIDIVATAAMFAASIGLWRRFGHPRLGAQHPALRNTAIHDAAAA